MDEKCIFVDPYFDSQYLRDCFFCVECLLVGYWLLNCGCCRFVFGDICVCDLLCLSCVCLEVAVAARGILLFRAFLEAGKAEVVGTNSGCAVCTSVVLCSLLA